MKFFRISLLAIVVYLGASCRLTSAQDENPGLASDLVINNAVLKIVEERNIPARTSGIIRQNGIREGVLVKKGELVMEIDNAQTSIEIRKSQKELEMAKLEAASRVDLEYAKRSIEVADAELKRAIRSNERRPGVVPQTELDQLSLVVKKSFAEKEKTEFQMEMRAMSKEVREIELQLDQLKNEHHQIRSPLNGMIVEVYRREGEWVETSESIARVVRLDRLKSEVKIPVGVAVNDLIGAAATFYPKLVKPGDDQSYSGEVVFIYPEANPISSEVRVWVEIDNRGLNLIPGITGRLEIFPDTRHANVKQVPLVKEVPLVNPGTTNQ
jgi:multidrug efflux pump subunit AcrA (membrane-fusion protein)